MAQSLLAARTGAHVAIIGAVGGFAVDTMPFAIVQAKRLRLQGVTVGSRRDQNDLVRAIEANNIRPVIDRIFPFEELADAFRYLQTGRLSERSASACDATWAEDGIDRARRSRDSPAMQASVRFRNAVSPACAERRFHRRPQAPSHKDAR